MYYLLNVFKEFEIFFESVVDTLEFGNRCDTLVRHEKGFVGSGGSQQAARRRRSNTLP